MKFINPNVFFDKLWKFFSSVKLAIVLFILIGLTSIIGTVIQQKVEPERNIELFKKIFGDNLAPKMFKLSYSLGFMDMYHSWWFLTLLFLISANIIICSLERLPKIHRLASEPVKPLPPDSFFKFSIKKEVNIKGKFENVCHMARNMLKKSGFKPEEINYENGIQLFAQRGGYTRYGVYLTHFSIIIILLGAVLGILFGFNGYLNLPEGGSSDITYSRDGTQHKLGFNIYCEDFSISFYGTTDTPKEYMSWLTIKENGKEVLKKTIEVNTPLKYKGYYFYQSSYGPIPGAKGLIVMRITPYGSSSEVISLSEGESFQIPGTKIIGKILGFSPSLSFDKDGKPFTYTDTMNNPAVLVTFQEDGKEKYSGWVVKRYPQTWILPDKHKVELIDNWGTQYTGLQVRKDPGVWVVYLGCFLMSIGLYGAFFLNQKKIWVLLIKDKGTVKISLTAFVNKNKVSYDRKIDKMIRLLK